MSFGIPQYPWGDGDRLFASALNAAIANGPYMPAGNTINVLSFGAVGDGVTDDTAAINAAFDHLRALQTVPSHAIANLVFPTGRYIITGPVNITGIIGQGSCVINGCGSELWLKSATAVLDCLTSRWLIFKDMTIYGDPTTTPKIGMQIGRATSANADFITMYNVQFWGNFTFTPFYNFASETFSAYSCTFDNNLTAPNAFCAVQDGINYWAASSTFVAVTAPANARQSNNSSTFHACTFQGLGTTGNVWIANANAHAFKRCYASNGGTSPFILYSDSMSFAAAVLLDIECHCETSALTHMLQFTGAAGITYALVIGLSLTDYNMSASVSVLAVDATSAITQVEIRQATFRISGSCPALFDAPSKYSVKSHEAFLTDGIWALPGYWSGPLSKETYNGTVIVPEYQRVVATEGGVLTMAQNMGWVDLQPAAALSNFYVTMPPSAVHGQTVVFSSMQAINNLQLAPATGQTVVRGAGSMNGNTTITFRYDTPSASWLDFGQSLTTLGKPTVTGSKAGNAALASLLTALAAYGLVTDTTTA